LVFDFIYNINCYDVNKAVIVTFDKGPSIKYVRSQGDFPVRTFCG